MQTIKIEIPEGFEVDNFDKSTSQLTIKPKPKKVTERIKTIADVLAYHRQSQADFDEQTESHTPDEKAYRLLVLLAQSLNEGWTPDWNNDSQYKYYPYFWMGGSSGFRCLDCAAWRSSSYVGSRLAFKSRELAEHAAKHFLDVYKQFMLIN